MSGEDFNPDQEQNINQTTGAETLSQMPSWDEHVRELNEASENSEVGEKSKEQRQVDDLEVLFSFCGEKDVLDILRSDDYGVLLDNNVSLVDLFNANALFNEQYYGDGYSQDFEERNYGNKLDNFARRRRANTRSKWKFVEWLEQNDERDLAREVENDEAGFLAGDKIRADEAKQTIADIAKIYFGEDSQNDKTSQFLASLKTRSAGEPLSNEQKIFLENEQNEVADRLLYDGHVFNKDRARRVSNRIDWSVEEIKKGERVDSAVEGLGFAAAVIDEFEQFGREDLVFNARLKLVNAVEEHYDDIKDSYHFETNLLLNYSDPYKLIERVKESDHNWHIIEPKDIFDSLAKQGYTNSTISIYLSTKAKDLKELGASDEEILDTYDTLHPVDFNGAESYYDGVGSRLIEAGIDRKKIIEKVFSSRLRYQESSPFEPKGYLGNESDVDVLERSGFDITDIAQTFAPDAISKGLADFIERGADAKKITEYMMSYREEFEGNIIRGADGSPTGSYYRMWFNGPQDMMVWDKNHPEGRMVWKEGMRGGSGDDYVFANLDILAKNGVTEDDILQNMRNGDCRPFGRYVLRLLEQPEFNKQKVMDTAYKKYVDYCKWAREKDFYSDEWFKTETDPQHYYTEVIKNMSGDSKKERDEYFNKLVEG